MHARTIATLALLALPLAGCAVAKLPFTATGKMVDWTTTSRDEADRNAGRAMRRVQERDRYAHRCDDDGRC